LHFHTKGIHHEGRRDYRRYYKKVKSDLQYHAEDLNQPLTAENVAKLISNAVLSAAGEGFKSYLLYLSPAII